MTVEKMKNKPHQRRKEKTKKAWVICYRRSYCALKYNSPSDKLKLARGRLRLVLSSIFRDDMFSKKTQHQEDGTDEDADIGFRHAHS